MPKMLTNDQMIALLKKRQGDRTAKDYAKEIGISAAHLSDVYSGKRGLSEVVLNRIGILRVTMYQTA